MLPPDSGSSPAMQLSAVDLPQPDGPSSAMNSPRLIVSVSSFSASNACAARAGEAARDAIEPQLVEVVIHGIVARRQALDARDTSRGATRQRRVAVAPGGRARYLVFCAPTCWSQILNASTCADGGSDCVCGNCGDQLLVFGTAELLDRVLALLRRHRQRHVLHRRTRIEVALVVGVGLRFRRQQVGHQVEQHGDLLRRDALRDRHVVRVVDPVMPLNGTTL